MFGAIIGDIIGSRFEFNNYKKKDFDLFDSKCRYTDDTIMTLAICKSLMECNENYNILLETTVKHMQELGNMYSRSGYGAMFRDWLKSKNPQPYNSFGNGSAMRVSAIAYEADTIQEVKKLSNIVTGVTHNHPEGLKGAEATAIAIFLARIGKSKEEIKKYIKNNYYDINFTIDEVRDGYSFDVTCQGSVPHALECFFESDSFEDAIRIAISLGGDSDTIAAITGSIAEAYYGIPSYIKEMAIFYLDDNLYNIIKDFEIHYLNKLKLKQ